MGACTRVYVDHVCMYARVYVMYVLNYECVSCTYVCVDARMQFSMCANVLCVCVCVVVWMAYIDACRYASSPMCVWCG